MRLINGIDLTIQLATCKAHLVGESEWIRGYKDGLTAAFDLLAHAPTVDAEPVKHGRWIVLGQRTYGSGGGRNYTHYCSECGKHGYEDDARCPNCGAKMDGEA